MISRSYRCLSLRRRLVALAGLHYYCLPVRVANGCLSPSKLLDRYASRLRLGEGRCQCVKADMRTELCSSMFQALWQRDAYYRCDVHWLLPGSSTFTVGAELLFRQSVP